MLAVAGLFGVAAGMMDGGLNTAVGLAGRPRLLNLLHAAYGVGTAIGPLVVTVAIVSGSWRPAYLFLVAVDAAVAVAWLAGGRGGRRPSDFQTVDPGDPPGAGHPSEVWSRRRSSLVVATGMAVFFVYTGVEVAAGQWEASFCRGHLGMSASAAGLATFGYWGALTGMRAAWALLPRPVPPSSVVKWGSTVAVAASAAIWWQPDVAVALAGFVVLGAALAGVFPALVGLTPHRIGKRRAQHVIAWQVGAAAGGGSAISAAVGLLIGAGGFAVLGPSLTGLATVLVGGNALLKRVAPVHPAGG